MPGLKGPRLGFKENKRWRVRHADDVIVAVRGSLDVGMTSTMRNVWTRGVWVEIRRQKQAGRGTLMMSS
jgi:hypothetical protein